MTKHVSDLTPKELDYWVAKARGWFINSCDYWQKNGGVEGIHYIEDYTPSTDGEQAMELLKEFDVTINDFYVNGEPFIEVRCGTAETQIGVRNELEALVCRAVIASHYGDEVPDDD